MTGRIVRAATEPHRCAIDWSTHAVDSSAAFGPPGLVGKQEPTGVYTSVSALNDLAWAPVGSIAECDECGRLWKARMSPYPGDMTRLWVPLGRFASWRLRRRPS